MVHNGEAVLGLTGGTFEVSDQLKKWGFQWNPNDFTWWTIIGREPATRVMENLAAMGLEVVPNPAMKPHLRLVGFGR
jgi:hypothetical protein